MNATVGNSSNSSTSTEDYTRRVLSSTRASLNLALGFPINSYVLWLILSGAGGTIASQLFCLNLTISGKINALASVFYFAWILTQNVVFEAVRGYVVNWFIFSAPLFQCCICVERYMAVVHPVTFLRFKPLCYRVIGCCVAWLIVIVLIVFGTIFGVLVEIFLGFYVANISVMSFCCIAVLRALKRPGPGEGQKDGGEGNDMKRKAFKIILIILIAVLVSYVPYVVTVGLQFCYCLANAGVVIDVAYTIFTMSGFVHPLLYIHRVGKLPCFKKL